MKREITRLGQGVDENRRLDPTAIERTVALIGERPESAPVVHAGDVRARLVRGFQFRIFYVIEERGVIIRNVRRTKRSRPWEGEE